MRRHRAFVCYSSRDRGDKADVILDLLRQEGIDYWVDTEEILEGHEHDEAYLAKRIAEGLRNATVILVVLTRNFQQYGPWAWQEYTSIMTKQVASGRQIVVPAVFEDTRILSRFPPGFQADFRTDRAAGEAQLLEILEQLHPSDAGPSSGPPEAQRPVQDREREDLERSILFLNIAGALSDQSNFRAALSTLRRSAEIPIFTPDYALEAGQVFSRAGDFARADKSYEFAERMREDAGMEPDPRLTMNRAIAATGLGRTTEALDLLDRSEQLFQAAGKAVPHSVSQNRGMVFMRLGRFAEALRHFEQARRINGEAGCPDDPVVLGAIGGAHSALGDLEQSLEWWDRATAAREEQALGADPALNQDRAQAFLLLQRTAEARRELEAACTLHREQGASPPPDLAAIEGRVLIYEGKPDKALEAFDRAERACVDGGLPPDPRYVIDRGLALLRLGRPEHALEALAGVEHLAKPLRIDDLSVLHELRADVHAALDRPEKAEVEYEHAVSVRKEAGLPMPPPLANKVRVNEKRLARHEAQRQWLVHITRCVDALRDGDYSTAALALTDAFEEQRTIFEPDVDVVRRELVRTALGRQTGLRGTLLERHRNRRALEQQLESAGRSPLAQLAGLSPGGPPTSLADLAPNEAPAELDLVEAASKEALRREGRRADLHLIDALQSAWRGMREQSLSSFEAALRAGAPDTDGRLARYVELEKLALDLGLPLDIQTLLVAVGQKAVVGEKGSARKLAQLVVAYTEYLGVPLGPVAQRMIDTQLQRDA